MNGDSFHWGFRHPEDDGETIHLRNLGPQRTYGTCSFGEASNFPSIFCSTRWASLLLACRTRRLGLRPSAFPFRTSPVGRQNRECLTHVVNSSETMAGIALKYDISAEDIRRTNGLWANDNVWPGQRLRIPVGEGALPRGGAPAHAPELKLASSQSFSVDKVPTPTEFLSKLDSSIEETKKATKSMRTSKSSHQISAWEPFPLRWTLLAVFIPKKYQEFSSF